MGKGEGAQPGRKRKPSEGVLLTERVEATVRSENKKREGNSTSSGEWEKKKGQFVFLAGTGHTVGREAPLSKERSGLKWAGV